MDRVRRAGHAPRLRVNSRAWPWLQAICSGVRAKLDQPDQRGSWHRIFRLTHAGPLRASHPAPLSPDPLIQKFVLRRTNFRHLFEQECVLRGTNLCREGCGRGAHCARGPRRPAGEVNSFPAQTARSSEYNASMAARSRRASSRCMRKRNGYAISRVTHGARVPNWLSSVPR